MDRRALQKGEHSGSALCPADVLRRDGSIREEDRVDDAQVQDLTLLGVEHLLVARSPTSAGIGTSASRGSGGTRGEGLQQALLSVEGLDKSQPVLKNSEKQLFLSQLQKQ